jgi:hypothetical protein
MGPWRNISFWQSRGLISVAVARRRVSVGSSALGRLSSEPSLNLTYNNAEAAVAIAAQMPAQSPSDNNVMTIKASPGVNEVGS